MSDDATGQHRVVSHLARLLEARNMSLVQLAALSGITVANLSVLKNGRARAIRFSTLTTLCDVLQCQPGDLLEVLATPGPDVGTTAPDDDRTSVAPAEAAEVDPRQRSIRRAHDRRSERMAR